MPQSYGPVFKKTVLVAATMLLLNSNLSAADDGTITFTGKISDVTCLVTGGTEDGSASQGGDFTVGLKEVSTTALSAAEEKAGDTKFYIKLSGASCTDGKTANIIYERAQSAAIDPTTGRLKNMASSSGAAKNVQIAILNHDKNPLNLNNGQISHQPQIIAGNTARFDYWAQYVATAGAASAGNVETSVVYSVTYN
ncbi:fimbrial protein [Yersinia enterocolitica]|uniref:fimbrial protein n=1 Tax=Yersinia enterocolitica TaxID=630 RepID=UPI000977B26F|nr:fimbrial protein [Yersinia enterocolitica]ELI7922723.1 type 1 fimbrial protein [Yersinia enterocolitica]